MTFLPLPLHNVLSRRTLHPGPFLGTRINIFFLLLLLLLGFLDIGKPRVADMIRDQIVPQRFLPTSETVPTTLCSRTTTVRSETPLATLTPSAGTTTAFEMPTTTSASVDLAALRELAAGETTTNNGRHATERKVAEPEHLGPRSVPSTNTSQLLSDRNSPRFVTRPYILYHAFRLSKRHCGGVGDVSFRKFCENLWDFLSHDDQPDPV